MNHIDSQERAKNIILSIEKKYPIDQWKVQNIDVWTYIRVKLYIAILSPNLNNLSNDNSIKTQKNFNKISIIFNVLKYFILLELFFIKLKRRKILFFGAHFHRVLQNGKYFNRFYDSMVDHYGLHNNVYMMEYLRVYKKIFNDKAIIPLSKILNYYKLLLKLKRKKPIIDKICLDKYNQFCDELLSFNLDYNALGLSKEDIINWAIKMKSLENFYKRLYKKVKPTKIVFLGYYGYDDLYAALIVANSNKIKTIDFQHGPQTNVHMAYSNWSKVPENGYNTMPKEFWNWDDNSKNNIDAWAKNTDGISTKVVGQPYITYCMKNKENKDVTSEEKVILYTMQTSPIELFTPKLVNLIKASDIKWILRLHPRNDVSVKSIIQFIKDNKIIDNCVIQDSIEVSLSASLSRSILHVTNYSGCTIEAKMMGVPTLLIHKVGIEIFNTYIDNRLVYYLSQTDLKFESKFNDIIKNVGNQNFNKSYDKIFNPLT